MSRVGRKPVDVPSGVTVTVNGAEIRVKGANVELTMTMPVGVTASVEGTKVVVKIAEGSEKLLLFLATEALIFPGCLDGLLSISGN